MTAPLSDQHEVDTHEQHSFETSSHELTPTKVLDIRGWTFVGASFKCVPFVGANFSMARIMGMARIMADYVDAGILSNCLTLKGARKLTRRAQQ